MATNYGVNNLYTKPALDSEGRPIIDIRLAIGTAVVATTGANAFVKNSSSSATAAITITTVDFDVQTDDLYYTCDGSTPSSSNGHIIHKNAGYSWSFARWNASKFLQVTTSAVIQASASQV